MKKTDLEKLNAVRLIDRMKKPAPPARFAQGAGAGGQKTAASPLVEKLLGRRRTASAPD